MPVSPSLVSNEISLQLKHTFESGSKITMDDIVNTYDFDTISIMSEDFPVLSDLCRAHGPIIS
jgi:hypothetical protein